MIPNLEQRTLSPHVGPQLRFEDTHCPAPPNVLSVLRTLRDLVKIISIGSFLSLPF